MINPNYYVAKKAKDGRDIWISVRLFNTQIIIGAPDSPMYDDAW